MCLACDPRLPNLNTGSLSTLQSENFTYFHTECDESLGDIAENRRVLAKPLPYSGAWDWRSVLRRLRIERAPMTSTHARLISPTGQSP